MKISLRTVLIALVVLVAAGGVISTVPSEQKSDGTQNEVLQRQCSEGEGVSLVVDFGTSSGKNIGEFCVKNFEATGWDLLAAAGLNAQGTSEYPTGFVCRLDNWPSEADQPCTKTPTNAQGTWAYFNSKSNAWQFSAQGASSRKPACGEVDGWRFVEPGEVASQSEPRVNPAAAACK